jgi:hypothetical protein
MACSSRRWIRHSSPPAREIREYFIPDFSNWKDHDAYKSAFDRLLKDLNPKTDFSSADPSRSPSVAAGL